MAIHIIEDDAGSWESDIYITRSEHDRLYEQWLAFNSYTTCPISFEEYVRRHYKRAERINLDKYVSPFRVYPVVCQTHQGFWLQ